jgi:hypothetical protein
MQDPSLFKSHQYLNRLALAIDGDAIDPYKIIKDFFYSGSITDTKDLFMETCRAALSEKYSWKEGSPGNLLYFYESLELLVEACFLVFTSKKHKKKWAKKIKRASGNKSLPHPHLPCSISADEMTDPFAVIKSFFELYSLKQWKQWLYAWMEAGLSDYTVLDSIESKDLLPYYNQLQRLMDASWCISLQFKKKEE